MWELLGFSEASAPRKTAHSALDDKLEVRSTMEDEALECDYEVDCTNLYQYIENENWSAISKFLETGYWPGSFFADAVPPHDQVRTWVTRFDTQTGEVRWSQLPLHLAIVVNAPYEVIGSLIELYPQAVRCTDDQHMLPLHLAMRHGSSDSVVDLLLAAFPEGVNAKGKNDRTPIDCAIRGPNKMRGRILGTFVERTKAKATKSITNTYTREIAVLQEQLDERESELGDVKSKLSALDTAKEALELELGMNGSKKQEQIAVQAKITALEAEKAKALEDEKSLFTEIVTIRETLTNKGPMSPRGDADDTKEEVEKLKQQITEEIRKAEGATKEELRSMKATVDDLHRVATFGGPAADNTDLRKEVDKLRDDLRSMEDTTKNKVAIALLKEEIESALQESKALSETQIIEARRTLAGTKLSEMEGKSNNELLSIKQELEALKREVKEKKLADKTSEDLVRLRQKTTDLGAAVTDTKTKQDLQSVQKSLDRFKIGELSAMDDSALLKINKDLGVVRMQLTDIEELVQLRADLTDLKKTMEAEVKSPTKKSRSETASLNSALKKLQSAKIQSKSKFELLTLKNELESAHENLELKKTREQLKAAVADLKARVSKELGESHNKSMDELMSESTKELVHIQKSLDKLTDASIGKKNADEVSTLLVKVEEWKSSVTAVESQSNIRGELMELKQTLEVAIKNGHGNKEMENVVSKIAKSEQSKHSNAELTELKTAATRLSADLKEKENAVKDLETIDRTIEHLLQTKEGKQRDDLLILKKTVDAIDLNDIDTNDGKLWEAMKTEITTLKKELENVDIVDKTKKDLSDLRGALEAAIENSEERTKQELTSLKSAVESIDTNKLDSSKYKEWEALKVEVDALKRELKVKECEGLLANLKDQIKRGRSKGLSRIETSRLKDRLAAVDTKFAGKTAYELGEIKQKLEAIDKDIPKESKSRWFSKKTKSASEEATKPKTKKGFMTRFGAKKKSPKTPDASAGKDPVATVDESPKGQPEVAAMPPAAGYAEEKKEDDLPLDAASKPPLSPGKVAPASTAATDPGLGEIPMTRTNSKPVESDGNEVEAVMVSDD